MEEKRNTMRTTGLTRIIGIVALITTMASVGYSQSFITNGLMAYFPFSGNANDGSGNGNNGIVSGAVLTADRFGNAGSAYYFNGSSAYITIPFNESVFSNDFTASVWFNAFDLTNGWPTLIDAQGNTPFRLQSAGDSCGCGGPGHLFSYSGSGVRNWFLERPLRTPTNAFAQVVVTKGGGVVKMYLDAQIVATNGVESPTTLTGSYLTIGTEDVAIFGPTWGGYFHGIIDDIRIYNRALTATEVSQLFAIESAPTLSIRKAVYLESSNLWVGTNYQVQVSTDLNTWTNYSDPFTATNSTWRSANYWDVEDWGELFFRLSTIP